MGSSSPESGNPYAIDCNISKRLDESNYLLWRSDVDLALESRGIRHFIDTKVPIPPAETLDPITNKSIPNPEYEEWVKTDQCILTQMRRTITEPMLSQIDGLKTAREVWNHFEKSYFDEQSVKIPELRHQLLSLQKGNLNVINYLNQIYKIKNVLWFLGHQVSEDDLVRSALGGLGHEYDGFVQGILAEPALPNMNILWRRMFEYDFLNLNLPQ